VLVRALVCVHVCVCVDVCVGTCVGVCVGVGVCVCEREKVYGLSLGDPCLGIPRCWPARTLLACPQVVGVLHVA